MTHLLLIVLTFTLGWVMVDLVFIAFGKTHNLTYMVVKWLKGDKQ